MITKTQDNLAIKMSITLDNSLKKELESIAKQLGKTKSGIIAEALEHYFDTIDLFLAEKRANDDASNFISLSEMEKRINAMAN